jgi:sensor histidine kinase YesM
MIAVERTNAELELALLLNKLQPHFLFNTFNNIYSLIRKDADKGAEALLQLSSVLEYIVYLKPAEKVPIRTELEVVHQYLALQRLKYGEQLHYQECIDPHFLNKAIPSLVLLSLLENAFKHGQKVNNEFVLNLEIQKTGPLLVIQIVNSFKEGSRVYTKAGSGNQNLKDRLTIFYGKKAALDCTTEGRLFKTTISIPVHEL